MMTGLFYGCVSTGKAIDRVADNPDTYSPGEGWTLEWSDEFNDDTFDTKIWDRQEMLNPFNNEWEQYYDSPDLVWVEGGYLIFKAEWDGKAHGDNHYRSGRILSNPGGEEGTKAVKGKTFLYGKIAARIQLPYGKGLWPAFWMVGDNNRQTGGSTPWPRCGEIDIMEMGSQSEPDYGQGTISGAIHHDPGTEKEPQGYNQYIVPGKVILPNNEFFSKKFHVFEIEWDPGQIIWKLDGVQFGVADITAPGKDEFHKPFYIILNVAVGGNFTAEPDKTTPFPQYMYVDWVRHYTR